MAAMMAMHSAAAREEEVAPPRELEVITADMETRLRSSILRIVRPALDEINDLRGRLKILQEQVDRHEFLAAETDRQRDALNHQTELTQVVSDRVEEVDALVRALDRSTSTKLCDLKTGRENAEKAIDKIKVELRNLTRDIGRVWEESSRLQEQHDNSNRAVWEGIGNSSKKSDRTREECMQQIREIQAQQDKFNEDLFGEGKGITKLTRDLTALTKFVQPLPLLEKKFIIFGERCDSLEKQQEDVALYCQQNQHSMEHFYSSMEQKLATMKEDFKQEGNRLISHHASLMKDVRRDYAEEIQANKDIREEITRFQRNTDDFCQEIADSLKSEGRRIDAIHRELVQDLDEAQKRRRKDRAAIEQDLRDTRRQITMERDVGQESRARVEFLARILGLVLEGERLSSSMLSQDFADRGAEQWLSWPSEAGRKPQPPQLPDGLRMVDEKKRSEGFTSELFPIDWRKGLAKNGYLPGKIIHQGVAFDRGDMLLLHFKLLEKAHDALARGPLAEDASAAATAEAASIGILGGSSSVADLSSIPGQPGAKGTAKAVAAAGSPGDEKPQGAPAAAPPPAPRERGPAPRRSGGGGSGSGGGGGGARQRPGSQGQPEAMGSRGTMSGPLGETAPLPRATSRTLGSKSSNSPISESIAALHEADSDDEIDERLQQRQQQQAALKLPQIGGASAAAPGGPGASGSATSRGASKAAQAGAGGGRQQPMTAR